MATGEDIDSSYAAIGEALSAWQLAEDELLMIFHTCTCAAALGPSSAAFLAVEGFSSRIAITDAVVRARLDGRQLLGVWTRLRGKITALKKIRNKIAHYRLTLLAIGKSDPRLALTGTHQDFRTIRKHGSNVRMPRLHLHQVRQFRKDAISLRKMLAEFQKRLPPTS